MVALAAAAAARGQSPAAPSLQITSATLRQLGGDLRFSVRLDRDVPLDELRPGRGRTVCLLLSPDRSSARRACIGLRGGRLTATITSVDADNRATGPARTLSGAAVAADGPALTLRVPAELLHVALGRRLSWRAYLQWRDGGGCQLAPEPEPAPCSQLVPASGTTTLTTQAPPRPAFERAHRLRLLATGDSMIQIVDDYLAQRLAARRGTTVRSDARIGTGISKPSQLDWVRKARGQAVGFKPDVTVMFIGANDGFPLRSTRGSTVQCCGSGWVAAYERRVEQMMRSYLRGGRSYVYWLTLPAPRPARFASVFPRVNTAIRRAAARVGDGVRVIDLAAVFTPGGRFRRTVSVGGQTIDARQPDGVHLSNAGASLAASIVLDRLRADHALP